MGDQSGRVARPRAAGPETRGRPGSRWADPKRGGRLRVGRRGRCWDGRRAEGGRAARTGPSVRTPPTAEAGRSARSDRAGRTGSGTTTADPGRCGRSRPRGPCAFPSPHAGTGRPAGRPRRPHDRLPAQLDGQYGVRGARDRHWSGDLPRSRVGAKLRGVRRGCLPHRGRSLRSRDGQGDSAGPPSNRPRRRTCWQSEHLESTNHGRSSAVEAAQERSSREGSTGEGSRPRPTPVTSATASPRASECRKEVVNAALCDRCRTPKTLQARPRKGSGLKCVVRRRPSLPHGPPCSTIGAERLNFRVRNGTGCFPNAMITETLKRYLQKPFPLEHPHPHGWCAARRKSIPDRISRTSQWTRSTFVENKPSAY